MSAIEHIFRNSLFKDWQKIVIDKDVLSLYTNKILTHSIPLNEIISVNIIKHKVTNYFCTIKGTNNRVIKFKSGAIKKFAQPYQNVESFAQIIQALNKYNNKGYTFIIGSNKIYYQSIAATILFVIVLIFIGFVAISKGNLPAYIQWKLLALFIMVQLYLVPILRNGKAKHLKHLKKLPLNLE